MVAFWLFALQFWEVVGTYICHFAQKGLQLQVVVLDGKKKLNFMHSQAVGRQKLSNFP